MQQAKTSIFVAVLGPLLVFTMSASQVQALSIEVNTETRPNRFVAPMTCSLLTANLMEACVSGPVTDTSGTGETSTAFAEASVNATSGLLETKGERSASTGGLIEDGVSVARATLSENFLVSGNGTVDIWLDVSGNWNIFTLDPNFITPSFLSLARIRSTATEDLLDLRLNSSGTNTTPMGNITDSLMISLAVADGETHSLFAELAMQAPGAAGFGGQGTMEFSGQIRVMPSSGVRLTFNNASFLTGRNNPDPVPEPATFLLFGSSFAGLLLWRYKKKR